MGEANQEIMEQKPHKTADLFWPLGSFFGGSFNSFNATLFGGKQILDANVEVAVFFEGICLLNSCILGWVGHIS